MMTQSDGSLPTTFSGYSGYTPIKCAHAGPTGPRPHGEQLDERL